MVIPPVVMVQGGELAMGALTCKLGLPYPMAVLHHVFQQKPVPVPVLSLAAFTLGAHKHIQAWHKCEKQTHPQCARFPIHGKRRTSHPYR